MTTMEIKYSETIVLALLIFFTTFVGYVIVKGPQITSKAQVADAWLSHAPLKLTILTSQEDIKKGLAGYKGLKRNRGVLFVMPKEAKWRVHTMNVSFPIDVFWLDKDYRVVDIVNYIPPHDAKIYKPKHKAKYILQTNADFAQLYSVSVGDQLRLR